MDSTITIKTKSALRKEAKKTAEKMGITLTTVINAYLRQFVRDRTFSVSLEPMPTKEKIAQWEKVCDEADRGKNCSEPFSDAESLFRYLKI